MSVTRRRDAGYFYALERKNCDVNEVHWNWEVPKENKSYLLVCERLVCVFHFIICVVLFPVFSIFHWRNALSLSSGFKKKIIFSFALRVPGEFHRLWPF